MTALILALMLVSPADLTSSQRAEVHAVENKLLAPCCYTQPIAVHGSDIAVAMRGEVLQMVVAGDSEQQIVDHYRQLYGDQILVVPDGLRGRLLFWLPVVMTILACASIYIVTRKMLERKNNPDGSTDSQSPHKLSDALREQIEREVGESL